MMTKVKPWVGNKTLTCKCGKPYFGQQNVTGKHDSLCVGEQKC